MRMQSFRPTSEFWERLFATEKDTKVTQKLTEIESKKLVNWYDGYFVEDNCGTKYKVVAKKVSAVGDNYMSDAYSVTVIAPNGSKLETFVKVLPAIKALRSMARSSRMHDREIKIYRDYIPALKQLISSRGLDSKIQIKTPTLYYCRLDENNIPETIYSDPDNDNPWEAMLNMDDADEFETILVLEDLAALGHRMNDKRAGANLAHVRVALDTLAQYHAAGIAYLREYGKPAPDQKFIGEVTMMEVNPQYMFTKVIPGQSDFLREVGESDLAERLEVLGPKINELLRYQAPGTLGPLETVIHGDFWNNNMMFIYNDENEVKDVTLVDLQLARHSHPCSDLSYYLLANTTGEFRKSHLRTVLKEYYNNLLQYLNVFGINMEKEGYSETQFFEDWNSRLVFGFLMALMVIPAILSEKKQVEATFEMSDQLMAEYKPNEDDSEDIKMAKKKALKEQTEAAFMEMNSKAIIQNESLKTRLLDLYREMRENGVF